ncbi:NTE family protein [Parabacteroides sp. PF5-5]|uniref:patatin-like phospholipase family protein n=1 Tax=unclassified Parabacteroides TaxID=2649774 RepID=UPI002475F41B|nr:MULTISPECIES: patatin-like phospholipase family protein [unclassified Parabacteroides]MDH6304302.1 NTE family protein [Parabacteroides sp. PH5-39]MDH6315545.1 NTE family protein [Parabacteroides sp. PF5-13]MDH6318961.1 NTE family protein [Parabacteroides sp. PH5-13]MDH6322690.1 NTE family protein [Parabacteroides sp. PH5-8]MDH6326738.1 NTE family protein [Parabacteroides sp. PH5-41]
MDKATNEKYTLGLTLSGGGVRGFVHIAALQAMNERNIYPDILSGTSAGALAGAFYADGYSPKEIYAIFEKVKFREFADTSIPQGGIFKTNKFKSFLEKYLHARTFEELKYPLRVVASDIEYGVKQVFSKGELIPAVIASCSVPIVFTPVEIDNHYFVDGGLFMNFPVSVIRQDCEKLIGVNVSPVTPMKYDNSLRYMLERTMNYVVGSNTMAERSLCDFLIESNEVSTYSIFDFKHVSYIYQKGYETSTTYLDQHQEAIKKEIQVTPLPLKRKIALLFKGLRKKKSTK